MYFNYKRCHSVITMALVDADYKFIWVSVGSHGSCSDAQMWNDRDIRDHIVTERIGRPQPDRLPHNDRDTPSISLVTKHSPSEPV